MKYNLILDNSYLNLNSKFYTVIEPNKMNKSEIVYMNDNLASQLGIDVDFLRSEEGRNFLSGSTNDYGPLYAQAYAGHQFGHFTILGDGRAVVLGEVKDKENNVYDLQLKGSGRTPYSRGGDGKATLYSMLREYLISEAIYSLNIPTTRVLSVVKTNEKIQRETLQEGGIICRVANSHIRVGTFEYAISSGGTELVRELADYAIERHFPQFTNATDKYQKFLKEVIIGQAKLIAKWQSVGFIHGVMNTDNMTISGETIDYGPCAFMDVYNPSTVFSSIDRNGRYAYKNQPYIGSWNLARFAETLLGLLSDDKEIAVSIANKELKNYEKVFKKEYYILMGKKLGIIDPVDEEKELIDELLLIMEKFESDYTNTFRLLTLDRYNELSFYSEEVWKQWFKKWTRTLGTRQMDISKRIALMEQMNPVIIPRNLLVEEALKNASEKNDYELFNELLSKLKNPYNYHIEHDDKFINVKPSDKKYVTFCGT